MMHVTITGQVLVQTMCRILGLSESLVLSTYKYKSKHSNVTGLSSTEGTVGNSNENVIKTHFFFPFLTFAAEQCI